MIKFQPTRPLRGATALTACHSRALKNFNPRAPCGARRPPSRENFSPRNFNPRAPCGARHGTKYYQGIFYPFQPTRPLRGATEQGDLMTLIDAFQPTRPLRGATQFAGYNILPVIISTHAPLAGRDRSSRSTSARRANFNPRAPCGARQIGFVHVALLTRISTHAPLAGRD